MQLRAASIVLVAMALAGCGPDSAPASQAPSSSTSSEPATTPLAPTTTAQTDSSPASTAPTSTPAESDEPATTPAPATTAATTTTTTTVAARDNCRRLTDFDDGPTAAANSDWFIVNDGVMGGRSNGQIEFADSVMTFSGDVVVAGGGFTSVRLRLFGDELVDTTHIEMSVVADDRAYGITLEDTTRAGRRSIAHRADFERNPVGDDSIGIAGAQIFAVSYDRLVPSIFGQRIESDPFDPGQAVEFGIIIADGRDGSFSLAIDWIDACS